MLSFVVCRMLVSWRDSGDEQCPNSHQGMGGSGQDPFLELASA